MNAEKQKLIELALSKLTTEEKELLGLVKKEVKPRVKKNYKLKINYMIGDANGHTDEEAIISINNPFLKIITNALDNLGNIEGHWGIMLDKEHYLGNFKNNTINKLEYDLLCLVSDYNYDEDMAIEFFNEHGFEDNEINHEYLEEFSGLLISDSEYSFLVFEGYKLK